jgi:hypothetical protein
LDFKNINTGFPRSYRCLSLHPKATTSSSEADDPLLGILESIAAHTPVTLHVRGHGAGPIASLTFFENRRTLVHRFLTQAFLPRTWEEGFCFFEGEE